MKCIVTGGNGFIATNFIKLLLKKKIKVLNLDKNKQNKSNKKSIFCRCDILNIKKLKQVIFNFKPDVIFHLAAESHVDQSIEKPKLFIDNNIIGTFNLLDVSRQYLRINNNNFKFVHVGTDEVFGEITNKNKFFDEKTCYSPNSPYSASKAASNHLVRAWFKTFNVPGIITNSSNNFGPFQHPEKFIPKIISCLLYDKKIPVYGKGNQKRDWLYVKDHAEALFLAYKRGLPGESYNFGTGITIKNIDLIKTIYHIMTKKFENKRFNNLNYYINFVKDRPGHDLCYRINNSKAKKNLKWKPTLNFKKKLEKTIDWYINNEVWLNEKIKKNKEFKRIGLIK